MTFADVISKWETAATLAEAMNHARSPGSQQRPVTANTVRGWKSRSYIPPARWPELAAAARTSGFPDITEPMLRAIYRADSGVDSVARPAVDASEYG